MTINIAELKTHLSAYLKRVRNGERIVVYDRKQPIAEIVPMRSTPESCWERLALEGKLTLGSQDWRNLSFARTRQRVPIQKLLAEVRQDGR